MKYFINSLTLLVLFLMFSCEDYLDKAPESDLSVEEVFKDFDHAQGFTEEMYAMVVDYGLNSHRIPDYIYGDDGYLSNTWMLSGHIDMGNLHSWRTANVSYFGTRQGNTDNEDPIERPGVWDGSLRGIRKANIVIENIDKMIDATEEEKNVILGQAYFFRAFFHQEIMKFWGRFPYIVEVIGDEYKFPRPKTYKECALAANEDFKKAAMLLPIDWDDWPYGQKTLGNNKGRLTKGAAYAYQGKNLLLAASPLMKGSVDTYDYDKELCSMAVDAFAEVLKLDKQQGIYDLVSFDRYEEVFWKVPSGQVWPGSTEFIFNGSSCAFKFAINLANVSMDNAVSTGGNHLISPTHNFIYNNYGMANCLSIEDDISGTYGETMYDPGKPFENRDPRFYKWITIDGNTLSNIKLTGANAKHMSAQLFTGGAHRYPQSGSGSRTGYFFKKYYPTYFTKWARIEGTPWRIRMRLTDVYLMYAEALHAAKGNAATAPESLNLSAEQVVNILRDRAGIPHVHPKIVADANKFMDELRRERSVELSYEAHRWVDIRRWVVAHLDKNKIKTGLEFPKDHSSFKEVILVERVCEYPKHYWLPFETKQTRFYEGFPQNPGW